MALVTPLLQEAADAVDVQALGPIGVDRQAQGGEAGESLGLAGDARTAVRFVLHKLVRPAREAPLRGHARVDLAQRARPTVAWIGIGRQARLLALGVDAGKLGLGHVDLAADFGRSRFAQPLGQGLDRAQVGGHVLAGGAVAAGRALDEPATFVTQGDGQAVDLELGHVTEVGGRLGGRRQAQPTAHSGVEGPQLVLGKDVAQREHRPLMADLAEGTRWGGANALGWRAGRDKLREGGLDGDQLAHQRVVLGVGDLGRVVLVVQLAVVQQCRREHGVAASRRLGPERAGGLDRLGRDRQPDRSFAGRPAGLLGRFGHRWPSVRASPSRRLSPMNTPSRTISSTRRLMRSKWEPGQ